MRSPLKQRVGTPADEVVAKTGELIHLVRVIGFHGEVSAKRTPALRGPVLADDHGRLVTLEPLGQDVSSGRFRPTRGDVIGRDAPLPGVGTRIGPWPYRSGDLVLILGFDEISAREVLLTTANDDNLDDTARRFFEWMSSTQTRDESLYAEKTGELICICCSEDVAITIRKTVAHTAARAIRRAASADDRTELVHSGWWLSRAATNDVDMALAVASLKRAGDSHWAVLEGHGLRNIPSEARTALIADAEARLARENPLTQARSDVRRHFTSRRAA